MANNFNTLDYQRMMMMRNPHGISENERGWGNIGNILGTILKDANARQHDGVYNGMKVSGKGSDKELAMQQQQQQPNQAPSQTSFFYNNSPYGQSMVNNNMPQFGSNNNPTPTTPGYNNVGADLGNYSNYGMANSNMPNMSGMSNLPSGLASESELLKNFRFR